MSSFVFQLTKEANMHTAEQTPNKQNHQSSIHIPPNLKKSLLNSNDHIVRSSISLGQRGIVFGRIRNEQQESNLSLSRSSKIECRIHQSQITKVPLLPQVDKDSQIDPESKLEKEDKEQVQKLESTVQNIEVEMPQIRLKQQKSNISQYKKGIQNKQAVPFVVLLTILICLILFIAQNYYKLFSKSLAAIDFE